MKIIDVTPDNVLEETLFCARDIKNPGFDIKRRWFEKSYKDGLRIKILKNSKNGPVAFIEYIPADYAWRPVLAPGFMFIHCMNIYYRGDKNKGNGSLLIKACEEDSKKSNMKGVVVMTSNGSWIADKSTFEKNGYIKKDSLGRFELMVKKFIVEVEGPKLIDWTKDHHKYNGWNLLYSDQCPWHDKSVQTLIQTAKDSGIDLKVKKINSSKEAQNAPSGFGTFALLHNGKLLEDHYLSQTRFNNILKKEIG